MIANMIAAMQGIQYRAQAENLMFGAMQKQIALADKMTGYESTAELARIRAQQMRLAMQQAMAQSMYLDALRMQEQADAMAEREQRRKERAIAAGAIYA